MQTAALKKPASREKEAAVKKLFEGSKMGARILEALEDAEMTQAELARQVGVRPQTINFVVRSGHSSSLVVPIARILRVSPHWLITGAGQKTDISIDTRFSRLPVLTAKQAVKSSDNIDRFLGGQAMPEAITARMADRSFAMVVGDNAMRPEIIAGDLVIVDPTIQPSGGDLVVAAINQTEAVLRRYRVKSRVGSSVVFELYATNEDHESFMSDEVGVEILGVVAEMRRHRQRFER